MDNEPFSDLECDVTPVEDFHNLASYALIWNDRWELCARSWKEIADDWRHITRRTVTEVRWAEAIALACVAIIAILVIAKIL